MKVIRNAMAFSSFELPKTDAYGTWIFLIGGILAMDIAVVLMVKLIRKKKAM